MLWYSLYWLCIGHNLNLRKSIIYHSYHHFVLHIPPLLYRYVLSKDQCSVHHLFQNLHQLLHHCHHPPLIHSHTFPLFINITDKITILQNPNNTFFSVLLLFHIIFLIPICSFLYYFCSWKQESLISII